VETIVTLTLVLLLASDASRMRLAEIIKHHSLPWRLLLVAIPLTVALGTGVGLILFSGLSVWVVAIVAVSLTPTDDDVAPYALGNPGVPVRIRQALNIEGGLGDGILLPLLLALIALATSTEAGIGEGVVFRFTLGHLVYGILAGALMGYLGARYIDQGVKSGWMSSQFQKICWLALVLLTFGVAEQIGGNGFIAAFVFGITSGNTLSERDSGSLYDFSETENTLLMLVTYVLLGMVMLPPTLEQIDVTMVVYALLSLTVVRMLPVAISMIGANLRLESVLFLGWFGPRGIPSILYIFTIVRVEGMVGKDISLDTAMVTVFFSIILHGLSAAPLSNWYARRIAQYDTAELAGPEHKAAPELPTRTGNVAAGSASSAPTVVPR
jgi:NhaP-type Na+/H+ or K+/H+ antiporter